MDKIDEYCALGKCFFERLEGSTGICFGVGDKVTEVKYIRKTDSVKYNILRLNNYHRDRVAFLWGICADELSRAENVWEEGDK